jgi:hypothetical protein
MKSGGCLNGALIDATYSPGTKYCVLAASNQTSIATVKFHSHVASLVPSFDHKTKCQPRLLRSPVPQRSTATIGEKALHLRSKLLRPLLDHRADLQVGLILRLVRFALFLTLRVSSLYFVSFLFISYEKALELTWPPRTRVGTFAKDEKGWSANSRTSEHSRPLSTFD